MVIEIDKILTPAITTLITSLVGGAISALVSYWSVKKTFESNTKREIAKFNVLIDGLRSQIEILRKKSSKVQSLENEVKKSKELFEELKNYLEQYLENSNRTGNN